MRRLIERPPFSDLFGVAGRRWLAEVGLPAEERETVDGCLRQLAFCESEIAQIRRLMTVPGVNVITAATFMLGLGSPCPGRGILERGSGARADPRLL